MQGLINVQSITYLKRMVRNNMVWREDREDCSSYDWCKEWQKKETDPFYKESLHCDACGHCTPFPDFDWSTDEMGRFIRVLRMRLPRVTHAYRITLWTFIVELHYQMIRLRIRRSLRWIVEMFKFAIKDGGMWYSSLES